MNTQVLEVTLDEVVEIAQTYGLDKQQTERLINRIKTESSYVRKEVAIATIKTWARQIKNENGLLLDTGMKRILEHLIASKDAEGLTIMVPGLSKDKAQEYIDADIADYEERRRRLIEENRDNNEDLDIAHAARIRELLSADFGGVKKEYN